MDPRRPWSDLPFELLDLFLDRLSFADHARFAAVCSPWRSAAARSRHHRALHFPWLLLPHHPPSETWPLSSPVDDRPRILDLPSARGCRCFGSSMGWLMMAHDACGNHLLNPFTGRQIPLPPASAVPDRKRMPDLERIPIRYFFSKSILSSPPSPENLASGKCLLIAFYGHGDLASCRLGDDNWSDLGLYGIRDAVFFDGLLYCLDDQEELIVYELSPQLRFKEIYRPLPLDEGDLVDRHGDTSYLVESAGELLMVVRQWDFIRLDVATALDFNLTFTRTVHFSVFKLDRSGPDPEWLPVSSLGDEVLFVGTSCSRSFTAGSLPGFRRNCIYFTDDRANYLVDDEYVDATFPVCDWGVFCLDDKTIQPLVADGSSYTLMSPPIWFLLNA